MEPGELHQSRTDVRTTYDRVAAEYANHLADELDHKPFDRKLLDWLVERVSPGGLICDLGCGPGHIARYISARGAKVCGIDLSPGMIEQARRLDPAIEFTVGDMLDLNEVGDGSWAGIAAFYAIVNLPAEGLAVAFAEMFRVLKPAGEVLLSFHIGNETQHREEWWGHQVMIDFYFLETAKIKELLTTSGFTLSEVIERDPYPEVEFPSRRAYIFARKPESAPII
ncbi:MAG: methyltransferase domain-containing protein [Pyrinomonadaceae bacterium]